MYQASDAEKSKQYDLTLFEVIRVVVLITGIVAFVQSQAAPIDSGSYEMSCRVKAKEIAAETYRGCVTENRKAQLDQIKSDYQAKLKALKDEYSQELKGLSSNSSTNLNPAKPAKVAGTHTKKQRSRNQNAVSISDSDVSVQVRSAPRASTDDSVMDIPEPVPVETFPTNED